MKKIFAPLITISILATSCVTLLPVALDGEECVDQYYVESTNPDYIDPFVLTDIFTEEIRNTWGFEKNDCHSFTVTTEMKAKGSTGLEMHWSHEPSGCDWIGVGFSWNDWAPIDMSGIENDHALQFYIRPIKGRIGFIPINAVFSDKEGNESMWVTVSSKHYDGFGIDDKDWTVVTIPLNDFQFEYKNVNTAKIDQLKLSFDGTADIYFDELKIVKMKSKGNT